MKMFLDIAVAWIALDVVLIATWHLAHVRSRRFGSPVVPAGSVTQRVYTLAPMAPKARVDEPQPALVRTARG